MIRSFFPGVTAGCRGTKPAAISQSGVVKFPVRPRTKYLKPEGWTETAQHQHQKRRYDAAAPDYLGHLLDDVHWPGPLDPGYLNARSARSVSKLRDDRSGLRRRNAQVLDRAEKGTNLVSLGQLQRRLLGTRPDQSQRAQKSERWPHHVEVRLAWLTTSYWLRSGLCPDRDIGAATARNTELRGQAS